jgi:thiol-disulfide isomerase/thioredoxin
MTSLRLVALRVVGCMVVVAAASALAAQQSALDLDGRAVNPLAGDAGKVVVLVFLRTDCPVSSRYAPVIQQISQRFAENAVFWLVYPDKSETPDTIRKYLAEYGYHLPALRDPAHVLVKLTHVQIAPEAAVFNRDHFLVYDGRIDDLYVSPGKTRRSPTAHELEDAIEAALAGKPILRNEVRGVGCYIADLE